MSDNPIDEAVKDAESANLDRALRNDPKTLTDADILALIEAARFDRARFILTGGKAPKEEKEE